MSQALLNDTQKTVPSLPGAVRTIRRTAREKRKIWFYQNRFGVFGFSSALIQLVVIGVVKFHPLELDSSGEVYDEIAFVSNLQVAEPDAPKQNEAEGEIKATDKLDKPVEDPRVAGAKNPYMEGAVLPIDLSPTLKPEYTREARAAGVEGVLYLEVVIADTGEVLLAKPKNRLGHGLERVAVSTYKRKRFKPAILEGDPITVRLTIPIRFTLQ